VVGATVGAVVVGGDDVVVVDDAVVGGTVVVDDAIGAVREVDEVAFFSCPEPPQAVHAPSTTSNATSTGGRGGIGSVA
jgi:hypothetical protein